MLIEFRVCHKNIKGIKIQTVLISKNIQEKSEL